MEIPEEFAPSIATFRGPPFCPQDPSMWFSLLECNFTAHRITRSLMKFTHATTLIPQDTLSQVSDVIGKAINSPTPYEDLRAAVLSRLQSSITTRLQELLSKEELGNEKPSDLLRRMKKFLGEKFESFDPLMFRHLYYQRLPPSIQQNLFAVKNKLTIEELAELADEFMVSVPMRIAQINNTPNSPPTEIQKLTELITKLTTEVNSIKEQTNYRSRHRSPSFCKRCRSSSRNRKQSSYCYYHDRFGEKTRNCTQPCQFNDTLNRRGEH